MGGTTGGSGMDQSSGTMGSEQGGAGGTSGSMGSDQSGMSGTAGQIQVDINTASVKELEGVPGMSRTMAKNIVKYRDTNGPFASVDDLTKVKGITPQKLDAMRSALTIGAPGSQQQPMGGGTGGMGSEGMGSGGTSGSGGMDSGGTSGTDTSGSGGTGTGGGTGY
ncbi:MAG TPA: helix-hairpin-helix domain-containing protein [Deltaproteobacteria bacterium]|nr:helix-hairpin-helix domain-containing protein [Deltaproteobacteria bacterium]HOI07651.1 helix-hairpin-helix domain-containing protein [Deltaproteobacteria bacterium]